MAAPEVGNGNGRGRGNSNANAESKGKTAQNNNYVLRQLYCFVFLFYPPLLLPEVVAIAVVVAVAVFPFRVSACFVFFALVIENEIRLIRVMATLPLRTAPLGSSFPFHQAQSSSACENISISEHCRKLLEFWLVCESFGCGQGWLCHASRGGQESRAGQAHYCCTTRLTGQVVVTLSCWVLHRLTVDCRPTRPTRQTLLNSHQTLEPVYCIWPAAEALLCRTSLFWPTRAPDLH